MREQDRPPGPIGILCAMAEEQELLVAALGTAEPLPGRGLEARMGRLDGCDVVVAAAGVGKVKAATTATLLVERFGCRALVLSGVAGGLSSSLDIGDLVVADCVVDVDYGRITDEGRLVYQPGTLPLPGTIPDPGYRLSTDVADRVRARLVAAGVHAALGTVLTGDAFLASALVREQLEDRWSALAIEMEGSAICGVAERFGLPWLVVRAVSDRAGDESVTDFRAFLASAAAASARLVRELLPVFDTMPRVDGAMAHEDPGEAPGVLA
jgi:adenosylhomocysteine nucleosidase